MSSIIRGFQAFTGNRPPQAPQRPQQNQPQTQAGSDDYFARFQEGVQEMMKMGQQQPQGESEETKRAKQMLGPGPMIMDGFGGGMMTPNMFLPRGGRGKQ